MGQLDWEDEVETLVEIATVTGHYKGGIRVIPDLREVIRCVEEKWDDTLRYSNFEDFRLVLYGPDGHQVAGESKTVTCTNKAEAQSIAENILPPMDLASSIGYEWRAL